ncbi:MAG TPA: lipopolysaccharide assembly protein LapA domain-containing protein [Actinoplanes sp.]|jgi:uncharacterized integral membrane protein
MAYPSDDRSALTPNGAEPPMPASPGSGLSSGGSEPLAPRPPGSQVDPAGDEPLMPAAPGSGLAATDSALPDVQSGDRSPAEPSGTDGTVPGPAETQREPVKVTPTRTSAMWLGVWAGVLVVILLIIFVAQNTAKVEINFLWMSGQISLALAMLIAGVAGAIIAMAVAAARIIQLRRMVRRAR